MKNIFLLGFLYLISSLSAHGADKIVGMSLVCKGNRNVAHLDLQIVRLINLSKMHDQVEVKTSIKGTWAGLEEQTLKLSQKWEAPVTVLPRIYFSMVDANTDNLVSFYSLGTALKTPDVEIPGVVLDVKLKTAERNFPYLKIKGVMGQLRAEVERPMNLSVFLYDGVNSVKIGNDDVLCSFVMR